MSILKFLAGRLKKLRSRHDLTQEQLATLLGTDLRWYQRIEAGEKDIRASTIDRLAAAFGVSASVFLSEELPDTHVAAFPPKAPHRPKLPAKDRLKR